jgi:hypothetical protein
MGDCLPGEEKERKDSFGGSGEDKCISDLRLKRRLIEDIMSDNVVRERR